ncbi:MAG: caspase family protein [Muribaculaceae bacterium]|nr:caspase family protein [Muribaculaceae bacterium]
MISEKSSLIIRLLMPVALLAAGREAFAQDMMLPDPAAMSLTSIPTENSLDEAETDSIRAVRELQRIKGFTDPATESYAKLRRMRFDGADEADFYPQVLRTFEANRIVVDSLPGHDAAETSKAVLTDIRPELLEGAFFYSKNGDSGNLGRFARAYVDIPLMPAMTGAGLQSDPRSYPTLTYIAASSAYNNHEPAEAIKYFDEYLATGDSQQRENVYMFLGQACLTTGNYDHAVEALADAITLYPTNRHLLMAGVKACVDGGRGDVLPVFLEKALLQTPDDEQLLMIQGQLLEDQQEYKQALEVFQHLDALKPNNLGINKHLALCYFNLGVFYYNNAIMESDEKLAKRAKRQSNSYFQEAAQRCETIFNSDPSAIKYLEAAAICYGCTDDKEHFQNANTRLRARGHAAVREMSMPSMIAYNDDNTTNFGVGSQKKAAVEDAPSFNDFGVTYVSEQLGNWGARGKFEKLEAYTKRIQAGEVAEKVKQFTREAETEYIKRYGHQLRINDLKLGSYDPDNETYLVSTEYGDIVLPVPVKGGEAELFASSWNKVNIRAPKFIVRNDRPTLAEITFVTPNGKSYTYNSEAAAGYTAPDLVGVDWNALIAAGQGSSSAAQQPQAADRSQASTTITFKSDVDQNIPIVKKGSNDATVALIIGNENYKYVGNVESANHDADVFAEYCEKTLGIPEGQIRRYNDASLGDIRRAIRDMSNLVGSLNSSRDVNVIVYYAGHGMPDDATKDAFLIPVDGDATVTETCLSLKEFYKTLDDLNARNVMVFMDACFSGTRRDGEALVKARGVALKAKTETPVGNMFVLTATGPQETAMPYREKNHGLFTYFLLKKLQESKGNVTLAELSDYVTKKVRETSNTVNKKPQTPTMTSSGAMSSRLNTLKLR